MNISQLVRQNFWYKKAMTLQDAYKILGVPSNINYETLKKRYHQLSIENHPDRGGDLKKMVLINQAKNEIEKALISRKSKSTVDQIRDTKKEAQLLEDYIAKNKGAYFNYFSEYVPDQPRNLYFEQKIDLGFFTLTCTFEVGGAFFVLKINYFNSGTRVYQFTSFVTHKNTKTIIAPPNAAKIQLDDFKDPKRFFGATKLNNLFPKEISFKKYNLLGKIESENLLATMGIKPLSGSNYYLKINNKAHVLLVRHKLFKEPSWAILGVYEGDIKIKGVKSIKSYIETADDVSEGFYNLRDLMKDVAQLKNNYMESL